MRLNIFFPELLHQPRARGRHDRSPLREYMLVQEIAGQPQPVKDFRAFRKAPGLAQEGGQLQQPVAVCRPSTAHSFEALRGMV